MTVKFYLAPGVRNRKLYLAPGMRNGKIYLVPNDSFEKFYFAVKGLKPSVPLATVERINVNAISVMEGVSETISRSPEERKVKWSRLEQIGVKLDNDALTTEEKEELMDLLIDNKDLFATDMSQLVECSSLPPFEMHIKDQRPLRQRCYRQTPEAKAEIRRQIDALKENGLVEPTQ